MLYIKPKQLQCNELDFLKKFLSSGFFEKINRNPNYEVSLIQEPYTGFGYADLVCVIWDKTIQSKWNEQRNTLGIKDIKILHHLYNCRIYKNVFNIVNELGFNQKATHESISKLLDAKLIQENKENKIKIRPINEIFYVKEIISIEAKLHDWKRALEQSINNTYFSSKSFTLFPDEIINDNLIDKYNSTDIGIISFGGKYKMLKKPKRRIIPSALSSWFFNEHIGREVWKMA